MRQVQKLLRPKYFVFFCSGAFSFRYSVAVPLYCQRMKKQEIKRTRVETWRNEWKIEKMLVATLPSGVCARECVTFTNNNLIEFEWKNNTNRRQIFFVTFRFCWRIICLWFCNFVDIPPATDQCLIVIYCVLNWRPIASFPSISLFWQKCRAEWMDQHKGQVHPKSRSLAVTTVRHTITKRKKYCFRRYIFYIYHWIYWTIFRWHSWFFCSEFRNVGQFNKVTSLP